MQLCSCFTLFMQPYYGHLTSLLHCTRRAVVLIVWTQCHISHRWPLPTHFSCSCVHERRQKSHGAEVEWVWSVMLNRRCTFEHLWTTSSAIEGYRNQIFYTYLPICCDFNMPKISRSSAVNDRLPLVHARGIMLWTHPELHNPRG